MKIEAMALMANIGTVHADELAAIEEQLAANGYHKINGTWRRRRRGNTQPAIAGEFEARK